MSYRNMKFVYFRLPSSKPKISQLEVDIRHPMDAVCRATRANLARAHNLRKFNIFYDK